MTKFYRHGSAPCESPILYRGSGLDGIYLCNGYMREKIGDEWFTQIDDIEGLHEAIALYLVENRPALAPVEIRFVRNAMDRTQAEIAQALGVDEQTVARWEKGKTAMPGPADRALRIIFLASTMNPQELMEFVSELGELSQRDAASDEVTFVRDEKTDEWNAQEKVLEDA